jgi:CheY-like chemotaxis protein
VAKLKQTILVVDDDSDIRTILRHMLEPEGFGIVEADNGHEALECLKQKTIDLIITDRTMPVMDGMALLTQLRKEESPLPVLMLSAYGEESLWGQAVGLGAADYLLKPFKPEDVLQAVKKLLKPGKKP